MPKLFDIATNRQGLIVYGDGVSSDYGIVVSETPSFEKPKKRIQIFNVQGRNGSVIFEDGSFDDVTRSYKVWLTKDARMNLSDSVNALTSWLYSQTGYNRLEDSFEPEVFRLAYFSGGQEVTNEMLQYGTTTLTFTCRPERFYKDAEFEISVLNGSKIVNPTGFASKPLIHIEGSGTVTFAIGTATMSATMTDYINIDCDRMNAYRLPSENKNSDISGSFPSIVPGTNTIGITGTVTKATIIPRYYTI